LFVPTQAAGGDAAEAGGEAGGRGDGLVTSVVAIEEAGGEVAEVRALGYVRVKAGVRAGDIVMARGEGLPEEGVEARVCDLPFASHEVNDTRTHTHTVTHTHTHTHTNTHKYTHIHVHTYTYVCVHIYTIYIYIDTYTYTYTYTHTRTYTHTHVCIYTHVCVCACVCMRNSACVT
jgi:methyl coenzyme M reductase subunit C